METNFSNLIDFVKENWIFVVYILTFVIQIFYIFYFYFRIAFYRSQDKQKSEPPVSIIIAARNEAENLKKYLPSVLQQNYSDFEVIVVNDASDDETETVLAELKGKFSNLYVTNIPKDENFSHGKKLALTVGIKAAKNELLLFTDADCEPVDTNWVAEMVSEFDENTDFVIGYGGYKPKKGLLNKFIRTDTAFIGMNYLSYALAGVPYMAVGRNMAFRKSFFFKKGGFGFLNLLSGSDDLFANRNANKNNLKIRVNEKALIRSEPKTKFSEWIFQKKRHFTTAKYYKFKHKFLLQTEYLSRLIFFITFVILLLFNKMLYIVSGVFLFRFLLMLFILIRINKLFGERKILFYEIFYDILQIPFNFVVYLLSKIDRKNKKYWK